MLASVPDEILQHIRGGLRIQPREFSFTGGGCINHGGKLKTDRGDFFLKWNNAEKYPEMFATEFKGLILLRESSAIRVPTPMHTVTVSSFQFILMEFIEGAKRTTSYWRSFGAHLATLHKKTSSHFGLEFNNYIGSLKQYNRPHSNGVDFFISQRLQVQLALATQRGLIGIDIVSKFEKLFLKLPDLLPDEPPSLVHGDLWSGNLITDENGMPCLIDPATHYGQREADLAMTKLFGGFDDKFFESYNEVFPLSPGFGQRVDIYNLYPILVHVNIFGKSYIPQLVSILHHLV